MFSLPGPARKKFILSSLLITDKLKQDFVKLWEQVCIDLLTSMHRLARRARSSELRSSERARTPFNESPCNEERASDFEKVY